MKSSDARTENNNDRILPISFLLEDIFPIRNENREIRYVMENIFKGISWKRITVMKASFIVFMKNQTSI